jgi:hypothetical protein
MSAQQFETFLARLYTDAALRARFLDAPEATARAAGLPAAAVAAMAGIDREGLQAAAESYAGKRASKAGTTPRPI